MNYTDEQIIQALENCKAKGGTCRGCAFGGYQWCIGALHYETLNLINRLKTENKELTEDRRKLYMMNVQ